MATYVIENQLHTVLVNSIYNEILTGRTTFYFYLGGLYQQSTIDTSFNNELTARNNLLEVNQIPASNISIVISNFPWTSGVIYDFYDDHYESYPANSGATSLPNAMLYCITSNYNVYKCLDNNNNSHSTVMPSGTSSTRFTTSDGYIWKYMYTVPASSANKFINSQVIPVQTSLTNAFYSAGAIPSVNIVSMGSGYTAATLNLVVAGDGTGCTLTPVVVAGQITNVIVTNPGIGYTYATVTPTNISGGVGTGATITVNLSVGDMSTNQSNVELLAVAGTIENTRVLTGGSGYTTASVVFVGDGTGATGTATLVGGVVTDIVMTNVGQGYHYCTATIVGDGTGANLRTIMSPYGGHGKNAVNELGASRILFYSAVASTTSQGFTIGNNILQVGLVRDIKNFGSQTLFSGTSGSAMFDFTLSGSSFQINDVLMNTNSGALYSVFASSGSSALVINENNEIPAINMILNNQTRSGTNTLTAYSNPSIDKFSGDILYIDNVDVVQAPDQFITFKTSIKF